MKQIIKEILKQNIWLTVFILCCITFLFYTTIKEGSCIEINSKSFKAGTCYFSE